MAAQYGKWKVLGSLGEGGQSHVYVVTNDDGGARYALKRLRNLGRLNRFKTEIETLRKLDDDGIINIIDYDVEGRKPYYVMPLYKRGSIQAANINSWSFAGRFDLFEQITSAVAAAHGAGITHRDLKPQNILLTDDDRPIIADFGICFVEDGERVTYTEEVAGPRMYCAPEIEEGRQEEVSPRSDVYSLGKILYWLLAGRDLPREYYRREQYDLSKLHEDTRFELINELFDRLIAESRSVRLSDASDVLNAFRDTRKKFERPGNIPSTRFTQRCIYCGIGTYKPIETTKEDGSIPTDKLQKFMGNHNYSEIALRVVRCDNCANVQLFDLRQYRPPHQRQNNPWREGGR